MSAWTAIEEIWGAKKEQYAGGFDAVRRPEPHPAYESIVRHVKQQHLLSPRFGKSESSRSKSSAQGAEVDIFGNEFPEMAHFLPHSPTCAATWAIVAQAIVGEDFETHEADEPDLVKLALQQLVLGKTGEDKKQSGLRYSPLNLLPVAFGHRIFFDDNPILLVVPLLDLDQVKNWQMDTEYWVMCIVGRSDKSSAELWYSKIFGAIKVGACSDGNERGLCSDEDLVKGTSLVGHFVKAHADILMGRGGENGVLTPVDLFHDSSPDTSEIRKKKDSLENTKRKLKKNRYKVKVPMLTGKKHANVLKLKLAGSNIPDPALVACKAAVSWSDRCFEKLLPACSCQPTLDPEESLLYEMAQEEYDYAYAQSNRPPESPSLLAAGLSGSSAAVVTPTKDCQTDKKRE